MRLVVTSTLRFFVAERLGFCCFKTHLLRLLSAENVHTHIHLYVQCLPAMFQKFHTYVAFQNIFENAKRAGKTCFARYSTCFSKRVRYRICNGHLRHAHSIENNAKVQSLSAKLLHYENRKSLSQDGLREFQGLQGRARWKAMMPRDPKVAPSPLSFSIPLGCLAFLLALSCAPWNALKPH